MTAAFVSPSLPPPPLRSSQASFPQWLCWRVLSAFPNPQLMGIRAQVWLPRSSSHLRNEAGFVAALAAVAVWVSIKPFPSLGHEREARHLKVTRLLKLQRH